MPPRKTNYSINDHKKAFELFYALDSMNAVSRELGIDGHTIRRWAGTDFGCSCPWHNWDKLVLEKDQILDAQIGLLGEGNYDPIAQENAILNYDPRTSALEVDAEKTLQIRRATKIMVRSDAERLTHLEYLWSKVFYHATGIVTDHTLFLDEQGGMLDEKIREEYFKKGADPKNLEGCIKSLGDINSMIEELKRSLGFKKGGIGGGSATSTPEKAAAIVEEKELTLEELRHYAQVIKSQNPEKIKAMVAVIKSEQTVEETLAHTKLPTTDTEAH